MMTTSLPTNSSITAYLALGSNLGDRMAHLQSAVAALRAAAGIYVSAISPIIETEPVGLPGQERYLNAAVKLETSLTAKELLTVCLHIERMHGRDRSQQQRWGPRTLDIDVLFFGDQIIDDVGPPRLRVPHPHVTERLFVLEPLAAIAGDLKHPETGQSIKMHLEQLKTSPIAEYAADPACFDE